MGEVEVVVMATTLQFRLLHFSSLKEEGKPL